MMSIQVCKNRCNAVTIMGKEKRLYMAEYAEWKVNSDTRISAFVS
jgi:hypothetical protein